MIPKFRAWKKARKELGRVGQITFELDGSVSHVLFKGEFLDFNLSTNEIILMQSTGLFDKNNKEIFEGDIVLVLDSPYTVFYDNEKGSYRLKPHDDRWNVDYMSNFSHGGNFEVVGNIYENKELLDA